MANSFTIALKLDDLAAVRGYRTLFEGMSLALDPGSLLELRGLNGAGKSTFLRILAGLTRPAAGKIDWLCASEDHAFRHFLGHLDAIKPQETVRQQAMFWASFLGVADSRHSAREALKVVGLANRADVPGRGLSAGQRRRLALTRLVMAPRAVWLLDEPLAVLDADGQTMVRDLIKDHRKQGGLVIAAMHGEGFENAQILDMGEFTPRQSAVTDEVA